MKKEYLFSFALLVFLFFSSCRKTSLIGTDNCLDRIEAISQTAQTYVSDPTVENCKSYLKALRKYIDSKACFGNIFFEEYGQALKELEQAECQ